jgi:hypothetical protein
MGVPHTWERPVMTTAPAEIKSLMQHLAMSMSSRRLDELDQLLTEDFARHC